MFVSAMLQMAIAWVYSHLLEYVLHRWWLHNRKRKHWFRDHFGNHHKLARKNWMYDYRSHDKIQPTKDREIKGLLLLALIHSPVAIWFPWAYLVLCTVHYLISLSIEEHTKIFDGLDKIFLGITITTWEIKT